MMEREPMANEHALADQSRTTLAALRAAEVELVMWRRANQTGDFCDPFLNGASGKAVSVLAMAAETGRREFVPPSTADEPDALSLVRAAIERLSQ